MNILLLQSRAHSKRTTNSIGARVCNGKFTSQISHVSRSRQEKQQRWTAYGQRSARQQSSPPRNAHKAAAALAKADVVDCAIEYSRRLASNNANGGRRSVEKARNCLRQNKRAPTQTWRRAPPPRSVVFKRSIVSRISSIARVYFVCAAHNPRVLRARALRATPPSTRLDPASTTKNGRPRRPTRRARRHDRRSRERTS